jgi:transposase
MPKMMQYTDEFKEQAVRFVFDEMEPDESRKEACWRLAGKLTVKPVTLYNWVKAATPASAKGRQRAVEPGTIEELRAQLVALKKENRELVRTNEILQSASAFFGAVLDRQSKK